MCSDADPDLEVGRREGGGGGGGESAFKNIFLPFRGVGVLFFLRQLCYNQKPKNKGGG